MTHPPAYPDDQPEAGLPAPGWDEGRAPVTPSYDYAALLRYDWQIRWTLYAALLPLLIPLVEFPIFYDRFEGSLMALAIFPIVCALSLLGRQIPMRLVMLIGYTLFFVLQYKLFATSSGPRPLPMLFWSMTGLAAFCALCCLTHVLLLVALRRLPLPTELAHEIGHLFGSQAAVRRVLEIYRTADEARANQAWTKQAGRQE